ncbi:MAG: zinc-dependent metalloprotease [Actinomycetota bacterium]|nr:zinc-dependent metalloprotease [Actinomycetota bacterium]
MTSTTEGSATGGWVVDWELAERVAVRLGARAPFAGAGQLVGLEADFDRHTHRAEGLVTDVTGLRSLAGDARARVVDRPGWIRANLASFQRLLRPLLEPTQSDLLLGSLSRLGPQATAVEIGVVLGWMSTRVLGQYDLLVLEDEAAEDQDVLYYVGPNVVALERRYAFSSEEFRLWLALHEVTHRAQFTGVEWMRGHYLSLVRTLFENIEAEPGRLLTGLRNTLARASSGDKHAPSSGVLSLVTTPSQQRTLDRIAGLMSLLEGHGDITMDRAGAGVVSGAGRFSQVMRDRRRSASGATRVFQRLVGLEAKLAQYAQGEAFIIAIESVGGPKLLDRVWEHPVNLPDLAEIRDPDLWLSRIVTPASIDQ